MGLGFGWGLGLGLGRLQSATSPLRLVMCSAIAENDTAAASASRLAAGSGHLGCHGTRYVRYARGWHACPVLGCVAPWGQAALCLWYIQYSGSWYA